MNSLLNRLFYDVNGFGHKVKFGDLHNEFTDYLVDMKVDYIKYNSPSDDEAGLVANLVLGLVTVLRTFDSNLQRDMAEKYMEELTSIIRTTQFETYEKGILEDIYNMFTSNGKRYIPSNDHEFVSLLFQEDNEKYNDYYFVQGYINRIFGNYHNDYTNQLTLITFAFIQMITDFKNRNQLLLDYLINFREMVKFSDNHNLYDKPNYRGYVTY